MKDQMLREIIPLTQSDCYTVFSRTKSEFDFPLHYHEEFELNFVLNAKGVRRVIGDHMGEIDNVELVLVGSNLPHAWFMGNTEIKDIKEVTIQFHRDLLDEKFLRRNQLTYIRKMLNLSAQGILFSKEATEALAPRLLHLNQQHGFDGVLELLSILHNLSLSQNMQILSGSAYNSSKPYNYNSRRIEKVMEYINQNFDKSVTLSEVAKLANMTQTAFSRFFKTRTGINFIDSLNDIRLGHACRMLIETTNSVSEIAYSCGFNNIANFNRIFKKKKACTPKEFRESFNNSAGTRVFI